MFAAIFLPAFALQAVLRWREDLAPQAVAVVDPESGLVVERSLPAAVRGVVRGLTASQAMARCAGLHVVQRAPVQERTVTELLIEIALRHSPFVERTAPDLATLDLRRMHPKIAWHEIGDRMVGTLGDAGLRGRVAFAPHAGIVRVAAREADPVGVIRDTGEFLRPLSLEFLNPPPDLLEVLHDWGVRTIGDFLALPAQEALERLGPAAAEMRSLATGRSRRPLDCVQPSPVCEESCDLGYGVETTEPLLFLLRRFLDSLAERLQARWLVASRMTLWLPLENGGCHERVFPIPEPTAQADILFRIVSTHLENLTLPDKPCGARLLIEPARPGRQQFGLFGAALRDPNRFGETLARLGAFVGNDRVGFPEIEDTHRPDRSRLLGRVDWILSEGAAADFSPPGLPLRRCRPAVRAEVRVRDGRPLHVDSAVASGRVTGVLGPYRLSGNWWEPGAWRTEEWDVSLTGGGLYRIAREGTDWKVEGRYD